MTLRYKAKNGRTYYLCYEIVRGGQRVYDLRKKVGKHTADALPPGYEIVDNGNFVSLRLTGSVPAEQQPAAELSKANKPTARLERNKGSSQPLARRKPDQEYGRNYIRVVDESGCVGRLEVDWETPSAFPPDPSPVAFCTKCSLRFPSMAAMREHMHLAHSQRSKTKSQTSRQEKESNAPAASGPTTSCHFCHELVLRSQLKSHIKQRHPDRIKKAKTARFHEMVCELCGAIIKKKNAARHYQHAHQSNPATQQPANVVPQNRTLTTCPECHVQVRADRLTVHLRKVHRTQQSNDDRGSRTQHIPSQASERSQSTSDAQRLQSLQQSFDERKDVSKYWGFMIREGGQLVVSVLTTMVMVGAD